MIQILFALLVQTQQPQRQPAAPAQAPAPTQVPMQIEGRDPRTPYDTTVIAIRRIGVSVAEVKSSLDALNRAAAREPDAVVVERAVRLQERCQALARSAAEDGRTICRTCVTGERAAALQRYREYLASLQRVGSQCATSVAQQRRGRGTEQAGAALRGQVRAISDRIATGFVPYEQRLEVVRRAFGWSSAASSGARRPT
jgi:hypothetical protein